ncbi:hypothetical protein EDB80DRAFT_157922 [Ilyonectria destructans]|nr:hypothetical protein EDB80DRAFT_157922 [Ilyonectria destructans]
MSVVTASMSDEGSGGREGSFSRMANPAALSATACTSCVPCVSCVSWISVSLVSVGVQSTCCASVACASTPCRTSVCCWFVRLVSGRGGREAASAVDPGGPMPNAQCSRVRGQITPTPTSVYSHSRHLHLSLHRTIRPCHHSYPPLHPHASDGTLVRHVFEPSSSAHPSQDKGRSNRKRLVQPHGPRSITQSAQKSPPSEPPVHHTARLKLVT